MSVDPLAESAKARVPQSWNRYTYVQGNPLKYVDPTGEIISLAALGDTEIQKLLEALNDFTGNTYGVDDDMNLTLLEAGKNGSGTATEFLDDLIGADDVYSVQSVNSPAVLFAQNPAGTRDVLLDFEDFSFLDYGRVAPGAFNSGSNLVHELAHAALGLTDPPPGRSFHEVGETVSFLNTMRRERGLPTREPIYGGVSRGFLGQRRGINFRGVNPRHPDRIYYTEFPKKLLNEKK